MVELSNLINLVFDKFGVNRSKMEKIFYNGNK